MRVSSKTLPCSRKAELREIKPFTNFMPPGSVLSATFPLFWIWVPQASQTGALSDLYKRSAGISRSISVVFHLLKQQLKLISAVQHSQGKLVFP